MFVRKIEKGNVGLVYEANRFVKALEAGTHIVNPFGFAVHEVKMEGRLTIDTDINELLTSETIKAKTTLVEVADNTRCMVLKNGLYVGVLDAGRYLYFKGINIYEFVLLEISSTHEIVDPGILKYAENRLVHYLRKIEVDIYEKGVLLKDGKFEKVLEAGKYFYFKNEAKLAVSKIDLRLKVLEVAGQEMLTKDKANLRLNFNLQYKVVDVVKAVLENKDFEKQLYLGAQLLLREVVGALALDELLENKTAIAKYVAENISSMTETLGVEVLNCGVRDIILPGDMKEIMNRVLVAQKKAQANVITRREETASTRSLLNTAKLLEENEMLYKLKEMEYLEKIADKVGEITLSGGNDVLKQLKGMFGK